MNRHEQPQAQSVACQLVLIQLSTEPLGLVMSLPDGRSYAQHLNAVQAQSLGLALIANSSPATARALATWMRENFDALLPEVKAGFIEEAQKYAERDRAALREMGVSADAN